jgi:hypothetical protein
VISLLSIAGEKQDYHLAGGDYKNAEMKLKKVGAAGCVRIKLRSIDSACRPFINYSCLAR